jgi:hypothetical protein
MYMYVCNYSKIRVISQHMLTIIQPRRSRFCALLEISHKVPEASHSVDEQRKPDQDREYSANGQIHGDPLLVAF